MSKIITHDQETRLEHKKNAAEKVAKALEPAVEDFVVREPKDVQVPGNFWELSDLELFGMLKFQKLTPEEANQVVDQLRGRTDYSDIYRVVLQSSIPVQVLVKPEPVQEETVISVELPTSFKSYKTKDQYLYLTKTCVLAPELANDIIDILNDREPIISNISYEIAFVD
jgi:hypothetical protein